MRGYPLWSIIHHMNATKRMRRYTCRFQFKTNEKETHKKAHETTIFIASMHLFRNDDDFSLYPSRFILD